MLERLEYDVKFSTGRQLTGDYEFAKGFTAITGPNESGKSMIFEAFRFGLFGAVALRGQLDDYEHFKVKQTVQIRGVAYSIDRTLRRATMKRGDEVIATGTGPVNKKVVEVLGFGIAVFDVANSINQGEVERLGAMLPTERRRLIDSVLGLDILDIVSKWATDEARLLKAQADGLKLGLVEPREPVDYFGYVPSEDVRKKVDEAKAKVKELAEITGWLKNERKEPHKPECSIPIPSEALRKMADNQREVQAEIWQLQERIVTLPSSILYTEVQLVEYEQEIVEWDKWVNASAWLKCNPKPMQTMEQLDRWIATWNLIDAWGQLDAKIKELDAASQHAVTCQNCQHVNFLDPELVKKLTEEVVRLTPMQPRPTETPPFNPLTIAQMRSGLQSFETIKDEWEAKAAIVQPRKPLLNEKQIAAARSVAQQVAKRRELEQQLETQKRLLPEQDFVSMFNERFAYEKFIVAYAREVEEYEAWLKERAEKVYASIQLQHWPDVLLASEQLLQHAVAHEAALAKFTADRAAYDERKAKIAALEADVDQYQRVKAAMGGLRTSIKQHVMPSLNRVSSHLLALMTGGQRRKIEIDENFNVKVDNQGLHTLSGSGKGVANLAIRIALGQVLTNRVFSVLLADEIDAAMDKFRAERTSDVLHTLTNSVSQVLLVSHKPVVADHRIQLGEVHDEPHPDRVGQGDL